MLQLTWLDQELYFPDLGLAFEEPDGLLAAGGDLSVDRLLLAYSTGIFPWYDDTQPIMWWSPNPRSVLLPEKLHISRSLKKTIKKSLFTVTFDTAFEEVISACADSRKYAEGTWITQEMLNAYTNLYEQGFAHSVEVWQHDKLVGGLYGLALGKVFFGESMFSRSSDASKVGFVHLVEHLKKCSFQLIDCQVESEYMNSFGAELMGRQAFKATLDELISDARSSNWQAFECASSTI